MREHKSFLNAVKWASTGNLGERGVSAVITIVLAGILDPRDFGAVFIAMTFIELSWLLLDQGFVTALIQRKEIEPEHSNAVFWMAQGLSLVLIGVNISLAGWWAARNHAPESALIIRVLALCIPIEALALVQVALMRRDMDFKNLAVRSNAAALLSGVVGVGMAFAGFRVWALVAQQIVRDLTALILLWKLSPWRPRLAFSYRHLRELMSFAIATFVAQLALFADAQAGSVILGLFFGPVAVGLYRLAERVTSSIAFIASAAIRTVSLSEFSRLQHDREKLRQSVLSCIRLNSVITMPALAGVAAVSGALMATLGTKWIPASGVLRILSLLGVLLTFTFFTGPLLQALSRPRQLALLEWTRMGAGTLIVALAASLVRNASVSWQITAVALARLGTGALLLTPVNVWILMRLSGISFRDLWAAVAPAGAASAAVIGMIVLFRASGVLSNARPSFVLVSEITVGGIIGLAVLLGLDIDLRLRVVKVFQRTLRFQPTS